MYREEKVEGAVDANIGYFEIFGIGKSRVGSGRGGGRRMHKLGVEKERERVDRANERKQTRLDAGEEVDGD